MQTAEKIQLLEDGHITDAKGFIAGGIHCGIRKTKLDFGWIHSEVPAAAAGVYTVNAFQAAPVQITKNTIEKSGTIQTVIVNSGNANSCTGERGMKDAMEMQRLAAEKMQVPVQYVAVASTGVIGDFLPMDKIRFGISQMDENDKAHHFEQAILTTDTVTKHAAVKVEIDGKMIAIGGAAKGSGMIHPNMATMLGFIATDACVEQESLQLALRQLTDSTFNMISVDGDSSTNDMVLLLANGMKKNNPLHPGHPDWQLFLQGLETVMAELAKKIARDGEGATKLIEVHVTGASNKRAANQVAKAIISSNLVKTAIYGKDPNWGRIVCAIGYSGEAFDPNKIHVALGDHIIFQNGLGTATEEKILKDYLEEDTVKIYVDLQNGSEKTVAWGCDLTYEYININASYRT